MSLEQSSQISLRRERPPPLVIISRPPDLLLPRAIGEPLHKSSLSNGHNMLSGRPLTLLPDSPAYLGQLPPLSEPVVVEPRVHRIRPSRGLVDSPVKATSVDSHSIDVDLDVTVGNAVKVKCGCRKRRRRPPSCTINGIEVHTTKKARMLQEKTHTTTNSTKKEVVTTISNQEEVHQTSSQV